MCHKALLDVTFRAFLLRIDEDLAAETRSGGCRRCGGVLHRDRYRRKPRGGPGELSEADCFRLSFTCSICDKRHTPASVRFLGRRVYLAVTVVLASALRGGLSDRRVSQLGEWIIDTAFWMTARGRFMPPLATGRLPASLLERFSGPDLWSRLVAVLRFLAPLSAGR